MSWTIRRSSPALVLVLFSALALGPWAPVVEGQDANLGGTRQLACGPGSDPEGDIQGRVPAEDHENGRVDRPYTCNTALVGRHGGSGGFKVHRYVDAQGQECGFYDSTLLFPTDILTQATNGGGVIVLDMSDPSTPVSTTTLTTPAMLSPHESLVLNQTRGLLAAVTGTAATLPGVVDIYDVSEDCTQPQLRASAPVGFFGHESGFAPDGMTFYSASTYGDSIVAIDVSDPTAPTPIAFIDTQSHGITASADGTRLYITPLDIEDPIPGTPTTGELLGGLGILDVTAIQNREPLAQATTISELSWPEVSIPQSAFPVTIDGSPHLIEVDEYVSFRDADNPIDGTPGAGRIIDISDETAPFVVSNFRLDVHDPDVRRSDAGLADDPGQQRGGGSFGQGYGAHYCAVPRTEDPGIVACSMIMSGLRVFDIRDPADPVEIAYFNNVTPENNPSSGGGAYAMSAPTFVPERREIWYSDANSGFYVVRLTNDVWPVEGQGSVRRLSGPERIATAVAASRDTISPGSAQAVVLARADEFADALAGGPLAVANRGPLLLARRDSLPADTAGEIDRALGGPGRVYVLGGTAALSDDVVTAVEALGHEVVRLGGDTRYDTAAIIARDGLGAPADLVVADGDTFADAVVASPVAASAGAALLLTAGGRVPPATSQALGRVSGRTTAIGRAAAAALPSADVRIDGSVSGDLSVDVAVTVFPAATTMGVARTDAFPDGLTAGAVLGRDGGAPLLLVEPGRLPSTVADHLRTRRGLTDVAVIFGGPAAVSTGVEAAIREALRP